MAIGKEIDNFVKTFLTTYKVGREMNQRDRLLDLQEQKIKGAENFDEWMRKEQDRLQQWESQLLGGGRSSSGSGSSGSGSSAPVRSNEALDAAASERMNYLINEKGLSPKVAAGIVGNTWHEGAGFQTSVLGDNGNSFGEFQFNKRGELPAFQTWARQNERNVNDWKTQYDFVVDARLKGPYRNVLAEMERAGDHRGAAEVFMRRYERPSVPHAERRFGYADRAFGMFSERGRRPGAIETSALPPPTRTPSAQPRQEEQPAPAPQAALPTMALQPQPLAPAPEEQRFAEEEQAFEQGGMVAPATGDAIGDALREVQSSYGLDREGAALPGTDNDRAQRVQAFQNGEGAISPEAYDALRQAVDPDGMNPDATRDAINKIYGFYQSKGDKAGAAKAAGGVLQAARNRSMEFGRMAGDALEQGDFQMAARALAAAYNEVPDGNRVTAEVNEQGVGRAVVLDAATDKVIEEMPLNPRVLGVAAMQFMGGNEFYVHLARSAPRSSQKAIANG